VKGAGDFYNGVLGHALVDGAQSLGAPLTIDALRAIKPEFKPALEIPLGGETLYVSPPPASGGAVLGELVAMMTEAADYEGANAAERPHLIAEATKRAFVDRAQWMQPFGDTTADPAELVSEEHAKKLMAAYDPKQATPVASLGAIERQPENPWATGFVTADKDGNLVACNVTMNNLFGAGRMAPGTGILLAPAPNERGAGYRSLGPAILANDHNGRVYFGGAASGGETAPSALAQVLLGVVLGEQNLVDAEAAPRFHHNGDPDLVFHEHDATEAELSSLTQRGHALEPLAIIGRVSALWCPKSLQSDAKACQASADPRGFGLAVVQSE
jgi:gamma-glutamyltranspeptidase/glutathione hydrolase